MPGQLSTIEKRKLEQCRQDIKASIDAVKNAWYVMGNAIRTIRDERLYREEHATWEPFIKAEFGISKTTGHRLISGSIARDVVLSVEGPQNGPLVDQKLTQSKAAELGKLRTEQEVATAWERSKDEKGNVPAKRLKEEVERLLPKDSDSVPSKVLDADGGQTGAVSQLPVDADAGMSAANSVTESDLSAADALKLAVEKTSPMAVWYLLEPLIDENGKQIILRELQEGTPQAEPVNGHAWTDEDLSLAKMFYGLKRDYYKGRPPNLHKWANEIRLCRTQQKMSYDEIQELIEWCHADIQEDKGNGWLGWSSVILSPAKMRAKRPQLLAKMKSKKRGRTKAGQQYTPGHTGSF